MSTLDEALARVDAALAAGDLERAREERFELARAFPQAPETAQALYLAGIDLLMRVRDVDAALVALRRAATSATKPWSGMARNSLALVLFAKGKKPEALAELRKSAKEDAGTIVGITAQTLLVELLQRLGKQDEAKRAEELATASFEQLAQGSPDERALHALIVAQEALDRGDRAASRTAAQGALTLAGLADDLRAQIEKLAK